MDVVEQLIAAVEASGMKHARIAADAGMSKSKFSKIMRRRQAPTARDYFDILRALGRDPSRILTDRELLVDADRVRAAHEASQQLRDISARLAAIIEELLPRPAAAPAPVALLKPPRPHSAAPVPAAANPNAELLVEVEPERKRIPRKAWARGARMIARAVGDSMDGGSDPIGDGELVYLKPTRSARTARNQITLVRREDALFLKRFEQSGRMIRLVSTNPSAPKVEFEATEAERLQIYGIVVDHRPGD